MEESRGSASSPATGMAVENTIEGLYISIFGVDGPQHDSEARSARHQVQMEESRGIASSPATGMAEETVAINREAVRDPSDQKCFISMSDEDDERFISILDSRQPHPKARSEHRIPKAPAKFREFEKDKNYFYPRVMSLGLHDADHFDPREVSLGPYDKDHFDPREVPLGPYDKNYLDPRVVSLGPYHHGKRQLEPMEEHKITAAKQFFNQFTNVTGGMGGIYKNFKELTGTKLKEWKEHYDAEVKSDIFARMMFLDGCFILRFIEENNNEKADTILEISNDKIPLIIRDMFLIENQLPFEVLDELMNLRRGSSSSGSISLGKPNIVDFIKLKVLMPMGFCPEKSSRSLSCCSAHDSPPLHLLDILRTILLDFPPSNGAGEQSYIPHYFGSVMELKEIGIKFKKRRMKSLMDISFKENLLFPRLWLPRMYINDTTISQLLNLTAFEADTYSGCGVTSYIHFMDSIFNDHADVKKLRSKGILHHSLGSDDEVARLFNTWPVDVSKDLKLYSEISMQIRRHRDRRVKISIAKWVDKYFGNPWTAISLVAAVVLLVFTAIQTYLAAFPRR